MKKDLIEYDVTTAAIEEMKKKYTGMKITNIASDKAVRAARTFMVSKRTAVEKRRIELNAEANDWRKKVNDKAKEITALLLPIEEPLQAECKRIDDEIKARREEKEAKEQERIKAIQEKSISIRNLGVMQGATSSEIRARLTLVTGIEVSEKIYQEFTDQAVECQKLTVAELEKLLNDRLQFEKEEVDRSVEARRLEIQREEQEAAQAKIDEENKTIKDQFAKLEADKKAEKDRKDREEFERKAQEEADIEARKKLEREACERLEKEAAEKEEKARQESLRPDKEKMIAFANDLLDIPNMRSLSTKKAQEIIGWAIAELSKLSDAIKVKASKL